MKILYHHRIASKDGQYVHLSELTRALREMGHEVKIVGPRLQDRDCERAGLIAQMKKQLPGTLYELLELAYSVIALFRLSLAAVTFKPDVLYERYNLYLPTGVWVSKLMKLPMLLEVNAPLYEERTRYGSIKLPKLAKWSEDYAWRGASRVLPVTAVLGRRVAERGIPQERICVIPNGINPKTLALYEEAESAKQRLGLSNRVVIGFTGFMREWHGLEQVVDLLRGAHAPERHLLLVGDGPAREKILQRARSLGVQEKLTITGAIPHESVGEFVSAFDIAVQPDVVEYASPLKLFDYLGLGRAIVAPDKENIREILVHGRNALLFDPDDPGALTAAIERLSTDKRLRETIKRGARNTIARGEFTWLSNAKTVTEHFETLVANRKEGKVGLES